MKSILLCLLLLVLIDVGQAQDRIALLRDTIRLGVSPHDLRQRYPQALAKTEKERPKAVFTGRPRQYFDTVNALSQRFYRFMDARKKRIPVQGIGVETQEFVNPDGTYDRVFCQFSSDTLTSEQEIALLSLIADWYAANPFPLKTKAGFWQQHYTQVGTPKPKRTVHRGPGVINSLAAARQTTRPDTVKVVALNQLDLTRIPDEVYRFPNLEELDLSRNALTQLPARLTADLPRLRRLTVLHNAIPDDSVFFTKNTHLRALTLQGNLLTRIPASVRLNRRLESLWMGNNNLNEFNTKPLHRLRRLTDLNLYNAGLNTLPSSVKRLRHLTVLDLYYNKLTALPKQLGKLKRLEQLALSHNDLTELPSALARLRHLQQLYAHHNRISQLPATFSQLRTLRVLNLGYNWITVAPPILADLPALSELDLNNNNIQEFPTVLNSIKTLKRVYLGSNPLFGSEAMSSPYAPQIQQLQARQTEVFY
ncbi:leucine-rich repeat domain-containing protein [Spirosoma rhododendri]|uniref:Leucine-rich repeat domain-containing protein n=1 Tax=Spirosoma rhododendri TaxID=2728024 RepID=A0A7L5DTX1_9BACT|nr:leucine-rich repeat domain-containing protein [Spirosoma rhododendri]QJD80753.1 leucine-rich repeat domain-containing protein [Spirosoma rhododendri]